jgi:hypothetical protein
MLNTRFSTTEGGPNNNNYNNPYIYLYIHIMIYPFSEAEKTRQGNGVVIRLHIQPWYIHDRNG